MLFCLTSCSFRFSSFDNLLRPPKLIGKYQGLQDSFENSVSDQFMLLIPENGEFQSSFVTFDIDSDNNEEAFVFYTIKESPDIAKVSYFEYSDDWKLVSTFDGLGDTIDKVVIEDINRDGFFEIVIGWNLYSSKTNRAFVAYNLSNNNLVQIMSSPYTYFDMVDVNGDGNKDLLSLTVDSSVPEQIKSVASVYNYNPLTSQFDLLGETYLDGNISSYSSVKSETVNDTVIVYIEANKGQSESITEVIYWNDEKGSLVTPLFDVASQTTFLTWRNISLSAFDVDHDSFLEIPTSVEMPGSVVTVSGMNNNSSNLTSQNKPITQIYFIKWTKFRNNKLKPVQYSVVNNELGYMLNIKSSWVGRITVLGNDGQWDYYRWDAQKAQVGELLFSIYAYNNNDAEERKQYSGYSELRATNSKTFVCQITKQGTAFGVTEELLESNLILTDFGGTK